LGYDHRTACSLIQNPFYLFFNSFDLFVPNGDHTYRLLHPDSPEPLPIPESRAPEISQVIKALLYDSQPMSIREIFRQMTRLFPVDQEFDMRNILQTMVCGRDLFLCDWHEKWYRPLTPAQANQDADTNEWVSFVYGSGCFKNNLRLQADIKKDLGESILMLVDAGDICPMVTERIGSVEFAQLLDYLEGSYSVFKVESRHWELGALLMVIPVTYEAHFVYSSPCFYAEANVSNETLKSSVSMLSVRVGRGVVLTLIYIDMSGVNIRNTGTPWSVIGPYLERVSGLTPGMPQYLFGDFNFDYTKTTNAWQSELCDALSVLPMSQVNDIQNLVGKQNDQVWVQGDPKECILLYEVERLPRLTKWNHTAIEGELRT
jgi:hypothetical protein